MKVDGCYANILDNCSGTISKEHVVTNSLIGDTMTIHYEDGREEQINRNDYVVYNLCQGHNNSLGKIESQKRDLLTWLAKDTRLYKEIKESTDLKHLKLPNRKEIKGDYFESGF